MTTPTSTTSTSIVETTPPAEAETVEFDAAPIRTEPLSAPVPVPVLAPYLGLVTAVLCALGGGWLLLAPYALDFRHGAKHLPRAATVDLETGAAVIAVGTVAAVLFLLNLALRLRTDVEPEPAVVETVVAERESSTEPEPEPTPMPEPATVPRARSKEPDPGSALRELLTPLVAALAADLRSHDQGSHSPGSHNQERAGEQHTQQQNQRQEP